MKKLTLLIVLAVFSLTAQASHLMGGEITYKYVGNDSFDITVKIYRDCAGITLTDTNSIYIDYGCGIIDKVKPLRISITDVTGIASTCPQQSRCGGTYPYGVQEHVFITRVKMTRKCSTHCEIKLLWSLPQRNGTITTGAQGAFFHIETKLDICRAPGNSSPQFAGIPTFFIPVGEDNIVSNTATDADGDILTYELTDPLSAAGTTIPYTSPWSAKKPLTFSGFPNDALPLPSGFHFDSTTSNIFFRPTVANQITVVTVKVREWRVVGGVLRQIGEILRDIQIVMLNLPANELPQFDGINPIVSLCDSFTGNYCFNVQITDADIADTVSYTYSTNISGATFTNIGTNPNEPLIQVCLPINSSMWSNISRFQFTIFVRDSKCSLPGKNEKTYYLKAGSIIPDSFDIVKNLDCHDFTLTVNNRTSKPLPVRTWTFWNADTTITSTATTLKGTITDTGWHYMSLTLGTLGCRTYTDSIYIPAAFFFSATLGADTTHCWMDTLTIAPQKTGGIMPLTYEWMNGDSTPTLKWSYDTTGSNMVWVKITDANNCVVIDSAEYFTYRPIATAHQTSSKICQDDSVVIWADIINGDTTNAGYGWAGFTPNQTSVTAYPTTSRLYEFYFEDSLGCSAYASSYVEVADPQLILAYADTVCKGDTIVFTATVTSRGQQWPSWWDSAYMGNTYKVPTASLPYGTHHVNLVYSDSGMCAHAQSLAFMVDSMPKITFSIPRAVCENASAFTLLVSPSGGVWSGVGITSNTTFTPGSVSTGWHSLTYAYTGSTPTCSSIEKFDIRVLQQPVAGFIVDKYIAILNDTFRFTNTTTADTTFTSDWNFGDMNTSVLANPEHRYADTGTYLVTLWVSNGVCAPDSATATVKVSSPPLSVTEITGGSIKLYPNPATSNITIEAATTIAEITLTDVIGRSTVFEKINGNKAVVDISGLTTGIYIVHVKDVNNAVYTAKVVVQR